MTAAEALAVFVMTAPTSFVAGFIIGSRYPLVVLGRKSRRGRNDD